MNRFRTASGRHHSIRIPRTALSMRFLLPMILLLCSAAANIVEASDPVDAADSVEIPDPQLRMILEEILKRKGIEKETLEAEDLALIQFLDCRHKDISDLSGLQHCTGLREAWLSGNRIVSVEPLSECRALRVLDVARNSIRDLQPISALTLLRVLRGDDNQIESLTALQKLTDLSTISLSGNQIQDLAPIASCERLHTLQLARNRVESLAPLQSLVRLTMVDVRENRIEDLQPLGTLPRLRWAFLNQNRISSLEPLVEAASADTKGEKAAFWRIDLSQNPLGDAVPTQVAALRAAGATVSGTETRPDAARPESDNLDTPAVSDSETE